MSYLKRSRVNKRRSARIFRKGISRTKAANMIQPQRGGWRL